MMARTGRVCERDAAVRGDRSNGIAFRDDADDAAVAIDDQKRGVPTAAPSHAPPSSTEEVTRDGDRISLHDLGDSRRAQLATPIRPRGEGAAGISSRFMLRPC